MHPKQFAGQTAGRSTVEQRLALKGTELATQFATCFANVFNLNLNLLAYRYTNEHKMKSK